MESFLPLFILIVLVYFLCFVAKYDSYAKKHKYEIVNLNNSMDAAVTLETYFEYRDQLIKHLEFLQKGEKFISPKNKLDPPPSELLRLFDENYAVNVNAAIKRMFYYYKDRSHEYELCFCDRFWSQIETHENRLSETHIVFAINCYEQLRIYGGAVTDLSEVDGMEGHAFEYWCANLLTKNGFSEVEVTPGSNDQGVDVLAKKSGIKYAIQCKCYSHDLGNTPVQEINTGKAVYRCQIGAVMTNRYFTEGAKVAAEATGVLLWDRDKLIEMLSK